MRKFLAIALAFVRRDFRIATSYKFTFLFQLTAGYVVVACFFFLSKMVDGDVSRQLLARFRTDYFSYILIGIAAAGLMQTALIGFAEQMRAGMTEGSLEMTFSCPVRPTWILVLPCVWSLLFETVKAGLVVAMGIVFFHAKLGNANVASCLLMLLVIVTSYSVFGILSAAMTMVLKRGDVLNTAFSFASSLVGGAFFPTELLPNWLAAIARVLPMTYAYDGLRMALLGGAAPAQIVSQLTILASFSVIGLPIAVFVAGWAISKAKRDGSLGVF